MLTKSDVTFYDTKQSKINKKVHTVSDDENTSDKGDYKNFMSKEIFEQSDTIKKCISEYTDSLKKDINIYNFPIDPKKINIKILWLFLRSNNSFLKKNIIASRDPKWSPISINNELEWNSYKVETIIKCAEELIGKNSDTPCIKERIKISIKSWNI